MRYILKKEEAGYFTVEAAILIPLVTMTMVFMIFLSFYCYDRCMLEQCAYAAALRGSSNRFGSSDEAYEEANRAAKQLVSEKLFAVKELKSTVRVSGVTVTVTYECKVNIPVGDFIGEDFITLKVSKSAPRNKTVAVLRQLI